jgi:putative FmdB family regulatory protein
MPTYEFRCPLGHEFEKFYRTISGAEAQAACPVCGQIAERFMSVGAGLVFKGSGFYLTDYGKNAHQNKGSIESRGEGAKAEGSKSDSAKSDSGTSSSDTSSGSSSESSKSESSKSESSKSESSKSESSKSEPKKADSKPTEKKTAASTPPPKSSSGE